MLGKADYTQVMGILNVTPDSFSDGGLYTTIENAIARAREIDEARAEVIDVGGESTRPGADPVSSEEELERVISVTERITESSEINTLVSIDTYRPDVAEAALDAGADIINDQNGLNDPEMRSLIATREYKAVPMDAVNLPVEREYRSDTEDVVAEVCDRLQKNVERAHAAGVASD
ncbi:dihydropteroate synthase [Haladaptatus halobius]|uniref:dihydropteroate synthase n=1 Tax=Haladaptatus halobius TaxID=2884875 RepID=UPI0021024E8C|nr:dihydropteroate synthase [Haladaptatus halobius]